MNHSVFASLRERGNSLLYRAPAALLSSGICTILSWSTSLCMSSHTKQSAPKLIHFSTSCEHLLEATAIIWACVCHEITLLLKHFSILCCLCQGISPWGKSIQTLPFIQHKMKWTDTSEAKGLSLDTVNIFPLFVFISKILRPDLATLCYIVSAAASQEDFGPPWIYVLCSRRRQLSWLVTADHSKMMFAHSYLSLVLF